MVGVSGSRIDETDPTSTYGEFVADSGTWAEAESGPFPEAESMPVLSLGAILLNWI